MPQQLSDHISAMTGFSRPERNNFELIKRLDVLHDSGTVLIDTLREQNAKLERQKQRLEEMKLESKETILDKEDIALKEKEIKRQQEQITKTETALASSKFDVYEIQQITEKLTQDIASMNGHEKEAGMPSRLELESKALPYRLDDESINKVIKCFEAAKANDRFSTKSKCVFRDAIVALNNLRPYGTFKYYDLILTGTVILVMMCEDLKHGPRHPYGNQKFFYPMGLRTVSGGTLVDVGKSALIEKKLPFDGKANPQLFDFLQAVFPNYLASFYKLNTDPAKLDTSKKTAKYFRKKSDKKADRKLLKFFKDAYLTDYSHALFKNPFSKMKLNLNDPKLTMTDVLNYVKENPNSRSARVLKTVLARDTQRNAIKIFSETYHKLYSQKTFRNPFSFMRRNLSKISSTQEIHWYVQKNSHTTSAQAFKELVKDERDLRSFLKR